ncbi:MAG: hypothetical protein WD845_13295, partial [Pirellulales bacterium]
MALVFPLPRRCHATLIRCASPRRATAGALLYSERFAQASERSCPQRSSAVSSPLKNAIMAFFNLAKCE